MSDNPVERAECDVGPSHANMKLNRCEPGTVTLHVNNVNHFFKMKKSHRGHVTRTPAAMEDFCKSRNIVNMLT